MRKKYLFMIFVFLLCVRFSLAIEPVKKETDVVIDITAGNILYDGKYEELKREHFFTFRKNEMVTIHARIWGQARFTSSDVMEDL